MITIETLRDQLEADFDTGVLRRRKTGRETGTVCANGYAVLTLNGRHLRAHRVIWALAYGAWPDGALDHVNGDRADNRLSNLRLGSGGINQRNAARSKRSSTGRTGVSWHKRKELWYAYINRHGHRVSLGYFLLFDDAVAARAKAEATYGYSSRHGAGRVNFRHATFRRMPDGLMAYLNRELDRADRLEGEP